MQTNTETIETTWTEPEPTPMTMQGPISDTFLFAGRAIFTVENPKGDHYTFRVVKRDPEPGSKYEKWGPSYFVGLLTGPDNLHDYTYVGLLRGDLTLKLTRASRYGDDSKPVKVLRWVLRIVKGEVSLPDGYRIHHEGRCGRCGRVLTVPGSVTSGFGPECIQYVS